MLTGTICLPGTHTLSYTVTNPDRTATSTATRRVIIYSAGRVTATFNLYPYTDAATADATIADLRNPAGAGYAAAIQSMRTRLAAAGAAVRASDILINAARGVSDPGGSDAVRVQVDATIHVYYPPEVGLQLLTTGVPRAKRRRGSRRLLQQQQGRLRKLMEVDGEGAGGVDDDEGDAELTDLLAGFDGGRSREVLHRVDSLLESLQLLDAAPTFCTGIHSVWNSTDAACQLHHSHGSNRQRPSQQQPKRWRRRLLQTSSTGGGSLTGSMSTVDAALQTGLGASSPSSTSDTTPVDVVGGYLTAISSSIAFLEERVGLLDTGVAGIEVTVQQTFGAEAEQKDATKETQITTLYDVSAGFDWFDGGWFSC